MSQFTRRDFLRASATGLATTMSLSILPGGAIAAGASRKERWDYQFIVIGDLHYDLPTHHDMDWVQREKPRDIRQIENYISVTQNFTPRLFREVARQVAAASAPVPFVVQIGDFVEGLCGSYDLQALQFRDAIAEVEQANFGVPFLMTKGNHDITGPGAGEAYDQVLLPWLSTQANQHLTRATFAHRHGEDLFIYFDAYRPDLDWLERTLASKPARHVFFIVHPPVVPYNARASWHLFARESQQTERARLLHLLGKHQAIVLGGHLHKYALLSRQTEQGAFAQLAINSVVRNDEGPMRHERAGLEHYTPDLVELEPRHSPETVEERRERLARERPFIESYEYADTFGYAVVKVASDRIQTDLYRGLGEQHVRTRSLQNAVAAG